MARLIWIILGLGLVVRTALRRRGVIYDHLEFGRRLIAGDDLYAPFLDPKPLHPVYPPSFGLLTWPFTLLPEAAARAAWGLAQVAALAVIGCWLVRLWERRGGGEARRTKRHAALALTALLASRYILRDTHGGGGNLINLGLVVGTAWLATRGRVGLAAFALGLSLATKPTTLLFAPLFWLCGHRRVAAGSVAVAAGLLVTALLLHGDGLRPLAIWWDGTRAYGAMTDLFETPAGGLPPFSWMNQCLRCALARYCGTVPEGFAAQVPGFFQGLGLSPTTVTTLRHLSSAVILIATFVVVRRDRAKADRQIPLIAAIAAASLLLSPISWKAHHVALIPALYLLAQAALAGRRWAIGLAIAYTAACVLGEEIVGKDFKNVQQSLYLTTLGTITLWALCLSPALDPVPQAETRGAQAPG